MGTLRFFKDCSGLSFAAHVRAPVRQCFGWPQTAQTQSQSKKLHDPFLRIFLDGSAPKPFAVRAANHESLSRPDYWQSSRSLASKCPVIRARSEQPCKNLTGLFSKAIIDNHVGICDLRNELCVRAILGPFVPVQPYGQDTPPFP